MHSSPLEQASAYIPIDRRHGPVCRYCRLYTSGRSKPFMATLQTALPANELDVALERGQTLELDQIIKQTSKER